MRPKIGNFVCALLLIGCLMTACGGTTTLDQQSTVTPSLTPSSSATPASTASTPSPGATPPPASASPTPSPAVYGDLTGFWHGDDLGYYYVRQVGNSVTWAGFSPDDGATYSNVLCASRSGNTVNGAWADVPRGQTTGSGTLSLQVDASNPNDIQIHKTVANSFGASTWHKINSGPALSASLPGLRSSNGNLADLSGTWSAVVPADNAIYYLRQVGNAVWWLGVSADNGQSYTNVMCSQRSGDNFSGIWNDVPRGATQSSGTIALSVYHAGGFDRLKALSASGGFGTNAWARFTL